MDNYQFEPYENNKNLNAFRVTNNGNDLVAAIIDAVETGLENTGITDIKTNYVEISDTTPVTIPPGMYDGTAKAKLSDSALAEIDEDYIAVGHSILGVQGKFLGADTFNAYLDNTLEHVENNNVISFLPNFFENKSALKSVKFLNATSISNSLFKNCQNLIEVNMPNVTIAGTDVFFGDINLKTVNIPNINQLGVACFRDNKNLETINMLNLSSIPNTCFFNCQALKNINMPNISNIGQDGFNGCISLTSIDFKEVTELGSQAFISCTSLISVNLPKCSKFNGYSTFKGCTALTEVNLPLLTTVGERQTFALCSSLQSINLPLLQDTKDGMGEYGMFAYDTALKIADFGSLIRLGSSCFNRDTAFETLIIRSSAVAALANINAFANSPFAQDGAGGTLYVPQALIEDYQAATNWSVILSYPNNQILSIEGSEYEITEEVGD